MITSDMEETARLIFMDENPPTGLVEFRQRLRENTKDPEQVGISETSELWARYMGFDGRSVPTHSLQTGERLWR